jgi:hypothetical protein
MSRRQGWTRVGTVGVEQKDLTGSTPNLDGAAAGAPGRTRETIDYCAGCDERHPLRVLTDGHGFCPACAEPIDITGSDAAIELDEEQAA